MSQKVKYGNQVIVTLSSGVRRLLHGAFDPRLVKESINGFKINILELDHVQVYAISRVEQYGYKSNIRRSGKGLVVLIS